MSEVKDRIMGVLSVYTAYTKYLKSRDWIRLPKERIYVEKKRAQD